ncbi:MAG TPA: peptide MFS transporter [Burkholderiales bacterium]|nr:peptide MFS transporter [Burkholderiales bacterium]
MEKGRFLGHPNGLYLLFFVEMWERFSYYGMRALLALYLVHAASGDNPGRGWSKEAGDGLFGWYTGGVYLLSIAGGLATDRLIGAHRSVVVGGLLIALGHTVLAASGIGALASNDAGMAVFIGGLVLIVMGTGHFKPIMPVMIDKLYAPDDPRRDAAFNIFYIGINVGAAFGPLACSFLGEKVGWHYGFGCAAIGMIAGIGLYLWARPRYLPGLGEPPGAGGKWAFPLFIFSILVAALVALLFHWHVLGAIAAALDPRWVGPVVIALALWFIAKQPKEDRGVVACILIFVFFNAVFWFAYEQAGTSLNHFADEMTNRYLFGWEIPAGWFQSLNAFMVVGLAPLFGMMWSSLSRRNRNPGQAMKLALGLYFLAIGYLFMVAGSVGTTSVARASMFWLTMTYLLHTIGELCMSPTGLAFVTRVSPAHSVSLLLGVWYLANAIANKAGGQVAGSIDAIESGEIALPWYGWFKLGGQADFFLMFVVIAVIGGTLMLALKPLLERLLAGRK